MLVITSALACVYMCAYAVRPNCRRHPFRQPPVICLSLTLHSVLLLFRLSAETILQRHRNNVPVSKRLFLLWCRYLPVLPLNLMTSFSVEATRYQLLLELSALRERYYEITGQKPVGSSLAHPAPCEQADCSSASCIGNTSALGKSDRDAIEAFFNTDDDDFTRMFNTGEGKIVRGGALSNRRAS